MVSALTEVQLYSLLWLRFVSTLIDTAFCFKANIQVLRFSIIYHSALQHKTLNMLISLISSCLSEVLFINNV